MTFVRRFGILILGIVLAVAGIVLELLTAQTINIPFTTFLGARPPSFGWTAYAPLTNETFVPPSPQLPGILAILSLGAGLILVAGWVGFRLGRRTPSPR